MKKIFILILLFTTMFIGCQQESIDSNSMTTDIPLNLIDDQNKIINTFLETSDFKVYFENQSVNYQDYKKYFTVTNVSLLDHEDNQLQFDLSFDDNHFSGQTTYLLKIKGQSKPFRVIEYQAPPIELTYIGDDLPSTTRTNLFRYINGLEEKDTLRLESGTLNHTFRNDQVLDLVSITDMNVVDLETLSQEVSLKVGMNVIQGSTEATAIYKRDLARRWTLTDFIINNEKTTFNPPREIIGRWAEYYWYKDLRWIGVMIVNSYDDTTHTYEGKYFIASEDAWPTGDMRPRGSYDFTLQYDLEHDQLVFISGEWILKSNDYEKMDFTMVFNDNMNLRCFPIDVELQSKNMFIMDQQKNPDDRD